MSRSAAIFTIAASRSDPLGLSRYLRKSSAAPIVLLTVTASSPSFLCRLEGWCGGRRFSRMLGAKQCAQRELVTRGSYTTLADLTATSRSTARPSDRPARHPPVAPLARTAIHGIVILANTIGRANRRACANDDWLDVGLAKLHTDSTLPSVASRSHATARQRSGSTTSA